MSHYEVAAENGLRVRVEADDQVEAFAKAVDLAPEIEMGGAYLAVDESGRPLPIGWDGGDPHDAVELGQSIDNGDLR